LSGYVSSADLERARNVARQIRTGMVHLNGAPLDNDAPFGGYKESGNGREWGHYGFEDFLEVTSIFGYYAEGGSPQPVRRSPHRPSLVSSSSPSPPDSPLLRKGAPPAAFAGQNPSHPQSGVSDMARVHRVFIWVASGIILLLAALVLAVLLFDWNRLRPIINEKASEALDRPFAIEGDLSVDWRRYPGASGWRGWIPWPIIAAEQLRMGSPDWAEAGTFVSLQRAEMQASLLALLTRTVRIRHTSLQPPDASLQRLADGRANWTFDLGREEQNEDEQSAWILDIGTIAFDQGQVTIDDAASELTLEAHIEPLGEPMAFDELVGTAQATGSTEYAFAWRASGRYQGQQVEGEGKAGGVLALQDADQPFPLEADVRAGSTRIQISGTLT